jgi:L-rhamnose mutarotase
MADSTERTVQRVGMVIGLRDEAVDAYRRLHADDEPGVRDLLRAHHITNFTIFLHRLPDGRLYEFAYYEYDGDDLQADLAALDAEPRNQAWLARCDPMQVPLPGAASWSVMEAVYHND